jgi:anthranilate phosphoribosyltransferase
MGFLFARACHPAMARVAPIRARLRIRTLFNRLGPLTNPMRVRRQLVGVADPAQLEPTLRALAELGAQSAWVVYGEDGLDELSLGARTRVLALESGVVRSFALEPGQVVPRASREALAGGDAAHNARLARALLDGEKGPLRDGVVLNAAAALCVAGRATAIEEGAALAQRSLDQGRAAQVLERLAAYSLEASA